MPSWLIPALKAVLPHVGDIVAAAKPVFTRKKAESAPDVVQQQIAELQAAAAQNAAHVKELAEQLQSTVTALQQAAVLADARLRRAIIVASVAAAIAVAAAVIAVILAWR